MLRPERMTLAAVMLLREHTAEVTRALAESECVEVARTEALGGAEGLHSLDLAGAEAALDALSTRLGQAVTALGAEEADVPAESLRIDPEHVAERVEAEFAPLEAEMAGLVERMRKGREARERADLLAWLVAALEQHGIDPAAVKGSRYIAMEVGSVPRAAMTRVREAAEAAGHKVFNVGHFGARALVVAVTVPEERQDMLDGLTAARFERAEIKEQYFVDGQFVPDAAEMEMWEVREDVAEAGLALVALRKRRGAEVLKWRAEVEANLRLLSAMERYSAGSYTCIIGAWIPTRSLEAVKAKLRERAHDGVEVRTIGFACDQGRHEAHEGEEGGPPTKLSNPWFIRPFEFIVGLYGSPAYDAIDPTPFVALTFVLFFGAMFGDVGHGAVLALLGGLGWFFWRKGGTLKDLGMVLVGCGLSAIAFGFVYGSIFGDEEIIRALWLHPAKEPERLLFGGVILGAVVINLGLMINVAQRFMARQYKEGLFGEWALSTMLFYWGAMYLFYLAYTGQGDKIKWPLLAVILITPLAATTFGATLWDAVVGHKREEEMAGTLFRPVELMLASLTNTISFVRVPAFALNHAALMGTVFLIAEVLKGPGGPVGEFSSKVDVVIGNITVIALEGLVVFVQSMRLQYYEFFGKFFHHQGRPFEPLALRDGRSVA